jgi:hypothetical protein
VALWRCGAVAKTVAEVVVEFEVVLYGGDVLHLTKYVCTSSTSTAAARPRMSCL